MKFSRETLMAYADGELDAETRRAIEEAMTTDSELAREIERYRALRSDLQTAFGGTLKEPVPERLIESAKTSPAGSTKVTDFAAARAMRTRTGQPAPWSWPQLTAIAASLLIGVFAGRTWLQAPPAPDPNAHFVATDGNIFAGGALAHALNEQPSGDSGGEVRIGSSFRAKSGAYCRTFATRQQSPVAGFACKGEWAWRVQALADNVPARAGDNYRMAGTDMPASILQAIDAVMEGEALDAEAEAAAKRSGWQRGARQ
jgi:hypothetical protein